MTTQLQFAKAGKVTDAVKSVARDENLDAELLRKEIAAGRLVIPANSLHIKTNLKPVGIGRALRTKINANIGTSSVSSSVETEIEKMKVALVAGADAIMDLSTGGDLDDTRQKLLAQCPVPFGTVPIYQVIQGRNVEDINEKIILQAIEKQAAQGVDFFTIHAGLLKEHLPLLETRIGGIVSRGGALLAKWMLYHNKQNPLYEMFDELCAIMAQYDICFSLGDGLRPGCIADATDKAQIAELKTIGELTARAQKAGCQVMVEGPGHVPFDQIQYNMELERKLCNDAPFYVLGPLVTDIAPGYDHITSAIGGTAAAFYGASFLCYVTPREHLGLPNVDDVRAGVIASKIAAHAADIARGLKGAAERDKNLSAARFNLDWETHIAESIDPQTAGRMHDQACKETGEGKLPSADYCSMCGRQWCSVRINKEIRDSIKG
ncbi:MAG: phosphomethylpyrimidine synthase ThiC [Phycisphaerae bacterium]|nr:phosphomethylpyrimidine synthase ThiC [Phycisphaerae bacterium]MDD5380688.1 phosphomethylpyrimidine synthase ThiC [Phycisphaerae bacterium]